MRLSVWLRSWWQSDPVIDDLITANRAVERDGMGTVDYSKLNRLGRKRWQEVAQAQARRTLNLVKRVNE